jgi:O-antigen ligase
MSTLFNTLRSRISWPTAVVVRTLVLLALAGALPAVGLLSVKMPAEYVLVAAVLPAALLVTLNKPAWGVLGIVVAAAAVRFTLPTGTESRIVMSLVVTATLVLVWLARAAVLHRVETQPSRVHRPLLVFMAVCVVSYVWSIAFRDPTLNVWSSWPFVQLGALGVMILLPMALLLASNWLTSVRLIAVLTGIIMVVGILALIGDFTPLPTSFLQVSPLFPTWFCALGLSLVLFNEHMPKALRAALLLAVAVWIYYMFVALFTWVSAWLPTMLAIGLVSFLRSRKLAITLLVLALAFIVYNQAFLDKSISNERSESLNTRLAAYQQNWEVTSHHLLFGVGPAGYAVYYMTYFPNNAMATHNNYIDIISETGIAGTSAFVACLVSLAITARELVHLTRGRHDFVRAFAVGSAGGLLAVVVAMALGDWVLPFVYTQTIAGFDYAVYSWVCLGAMAALHRIVAASSGVAFSEAAAGEAAENGAAEGTVPTEAQEAGA